MVSAKSMICISRNDLTDVNTWDSIDTVREFCTKWWKRIATVDMLFIGVLTLLASLFASWLKQFPGFSLFGALIIALLIAKSEARS